MLYPRYEADATAEIDSQVLYPRFEADATTEIDSQYAETQMGVQGAKEDGKGSWMGDEQWKDTTRRRNGTRPAVHILEENSENEEQGQRGTEDQEDERRLT